MKIFLDIVVGFVLALLMVSALIAAAIFSNLAVGAFLLIFAIALAVILWR